MLLIVVCTGKNMNWIGGARNRIKLQGERKIQQVYYLHNLISAFLFFFQSTRLFGMPNGILVTSVYTHIKNFQKYDLQKLPTA